MGVSQSSPFQRFLGFIWPIEKHELKLIIPMMIMLFSTCFIYSIIRNLKDAIVITGSTAGAEALPFIKVWAIMPTAIFLTFLFTKLSNRYSQERVYYMMVGGFLAFYALFAFVLYPYRDYLHPHELADKMELLLPTGARGFIAMFRNWSFTGFYVMSELWASIALSVLFWGFANEITKVSDARRFYGVFGVGSNLAAAFAGLMGIYISNIEFNPSLPFGRDAWEQTLMMEVILVIFLGLLIIGAFWWLNRTVLNAPEYDTLHTTKREIKKKKRVSLRESLSYLSQSKYLLCIAVLVISYNLVINLVEVVWKDQLRELYPDSTDYNIYLNKLTLTMGIISTSTSFFIAKIIGGAGWTRTALITPVLMLVTSAGFFGFGFFRGYMGEVIFMLTGMTPLAIAVFFGSAQNCLSKAAKYSVFDATKEMAFIPLDHDVKLKGKAVIDGVGSRFGKSGGSVIHQVLLMLLGSFSASMPYVALILFGAIGLWMMAVRVLGVEFAALVTKKHEHAAGINEPVESESPTRAAAV